MSFGLANPRAASTSHSKPYSLFPMVERTNEIPTPVYTKAGLNHRFDVGLLNCHLEMANFTRTITYQRRKEEFLVDIRTQQWTKIHARSREWATPDRDVQLSGSKGTKVARDSSLIFDTKIVNTQV